ncbi:MAG TPA: hypothetical protein VM597_18435 [Gemmataceae bacterium]|jgi:hypothetical protein|nr:hypothetical protein [Gemmataceae bacterium]
MRRLVLALSALVAVGGSARAQIAGPASPVPAPNPYSRQTQPLSPYLNLLRGGNSAVNYYYGVRQGTGPGVQGMMGQPGLAPRQTFFPVVDTLAEFQSEESKGLPRMAPTGHPVGFNNTMGYFGQGPRAGAAQLGQPRRR